MYFISKSIIEIPLAFIQMCVLYLIAYNLCELQGFWFYLILVSWGVGISADSLGIMLGCIASDVKQVSEMAPGLFIPQVLFAGFFVKISQIPIFLRWAQYLCALKYGVNLLLIVEFDSSNESCRRNLMAAHNCATLLANNDVKPELWWVNVLMLGVLFFGFRVIGSVVLMRKAQRFD